MGRSSRSGDGRSNQFSPSSSKKNKYKSKANSAKASRSSAKYRKGGGGGGTASFQVFIGADGNVHHERKKAAKQQQQLFAASSSSKKSSRKRSSNNKFLDPFPDVAKSLSRISRKRKNSWDPVSPASPGRRKSGASFKCDNNYNNTVVSGFAIQLPAKHSGEQVHKIPWMAPLVAQRKLPPANHVSVEQEEDSAPATATTSNSYAALSSPRRGKSSSSRKPRLPTDDVDAGLLLQLDEEMEAFADYVRLSDHERRARDAVLVELGNLAERIARKRHAPKSDSGCLSQLCVYGSYASPDVCTFLSDMDVAVWGALPGLPTQPPVCPKKAPSRPITRAAAATTPRPTRKPTPEEAVVATQKLDWQEALDAVDVENQFSPGNLLAMAAPEANEEKEEENKQLQTEKEKREQEALPLFVIDTTGDLDEEEAENTKVAKVKNADPERKNEASESRDDQSRSKDGKRVVEIQEKQVVEIQDDSDSEKAGEECKSSVHNCNEVIEIDGEEEEENVKRVKRNLDGSVIENDAVEGNGVIELENKGKGKDEKDGGVEVIEIDEDDESDADSADKLSTLKKRENTPKRMNTPMQRLVSLNTSDTESSTSELDGDDDDDDDYDDQEEIDLENESDDDMQQVRKEDAVSALNELNKLLRKSQLSTSVNFIRKARVPIVKFMTRLGVEVDVSIGGMNGADTSLFAREQAANYESFAPVVLVLKIIMGQHSLDTPFTGGLGSFKLYVLVAYHIRRHIRLGGVDRPGEILMSFLFRYGASTGNHSVNQEAKTELTQDEPIHFSNTCDADLSNVFKLVECCHLFGSVWKRLWWRMNSNQSHERASKATRSSLLAELIHVQRLEVGRRRSRELAGVPEIKQGPKAKPKNDKANNAVNNNKPSSATSKSKKARKIKGDKSGAELAAGYGMELSENGGIHARKRAKRKN